MLEKQALPPRARPRVVRHAFFVALGFDRVKKCIQTTCTVFRKVPHKIVFQKVLYYFVTLLIEPFDRQVPILLLPGHRAGLHAVQTLRHVRGHLVEDDLPSRRNRIVPPKLVRHPLEKRKFRLVDVGHDAEMYVRHALKSKQGSCTVLQMKKMFFIFTIIRS